MLRKTALTILTAFLLSAGTYAQQTLVGGETVTMGNVDTYIGSPARFVDLRNYADLMNGGYIAGFEVVPFFQYLEGRALVRNAGWKFSPADVKDAVVLENIFGPKDQAIVLMCASGTRAGYVKDALESLGYKKVYNAGGFKDYKGARKVLGDGSYDGQLALPAAVDMGNIDTYLGRVGAKYVDLRNVGDKYKSGYVDGFEVVSFFEYLDENALKRNNGWKFSEADIVSKIILQNIFGNKNREIFLMCASGTRAGYVKEALESLGYKKVYNVGGFKDYKGKRKVLGDETFSLVLK
jgi:rhodanese-related sulfurtransferase